MKWQWKQNICEEIFNRKYMLDEDSTTTVEQVFELIAREIAACESVDKRKEVENLFFRQMLSGRLMPSGRILANARPNSRLKNYNNCFTIDIEDSMEGIFDSLKEDATISKMGGGVGFDISRLRPKGDKLSRGGNSSGVISFLKIFDQSAKTIMTGGQRRSAHIALLDISHPEIESFITAKRGEQNNELTQFNISVKVSDAFIKAVKEDRMWQLTFQNRVYKELKARDLYNLLAKNAFEHNEPGIFCSDNVEKYNNGWWAFKMDRVNPCGELVMPPYSLCCLSAVNLLKFVNAPFSSQAAFDYKTFAETVAAAIRFLDNVLEMTEYPLEKIRDFSRRWRRVGLGFTGLADAMAMLGIIYGSPESLAFVEQVGKALRDSSYRASALLAKEKGAFPAYDREKFLQANFVRSLPDDIIQLIAENGMRNVQLNTVAPTGTTSLSIGNNCSSGIEPIFNLCYSRNIRNGNGDEVKQEFVVDYAWQLYCRMFEQPLDKTETAPDYFITTSQIEPRKAIDIQGVMQRYIDHSISKTLNLPGGTSFDQYKDLFIYAYDQGLKGFTTFNPDGSMRGILENREQKNKEENYIHRFAAPKRPQDLQCDIHSIKVQGDMHIVLVGLLNHTLYEIFVIDDPKNELKLDKCKKGIVRKEGHGKWCLLNENGQLLLKEFTKVYNSANASLARFISMALRHGTPLQFVVEQLQKDHNFVGFERSVSRVLKKYIKDGEQVLTDDNSCIECGGQLVFRDGCETCTACGYSKCN